jgi:hypothetical protein
MTALVGAWRLGLRHLGVRRSVRLARLTAQPFERAGCKAEPVLLARAERGAWRASRLVPGAACLHRALAVRLWLAWHGQASQVVVGFRQRGEVQGHAWLEVGEQRLFAGELETYPSVLSEQTLLGE